MLSDMFSLLLGMMSAIAANVLYDLIKQKLPRSEVGRKRARLEIRSAKGQHIEFEVKADMSEQETQGVLASIEELKRKQADSSGPHITIS